MWPSASRVFAPICSLERVPQAIEFPREREPSRAVPLLHELERTVWLIPETFTGEQPVDAREVPPPDDPPSNVFVATRSRTRSTSSSR